jgi:hypothetical protein
MTVANPDSVLDSVKQALGLSPDSTSFDLEVTMHINAVIGFLQGIGVNNNGALYVSDNTTHWVSITSRQDLINLTKTYMFLKVKSIFDPPANPKVIDAMERQILEFEWRLQHMAEMPYSETAPVILANRWWILNGFSDFPAGAVTGDLGIDFPSGTVWAENVIPANAGMYNLTGLTDFPVDAVIGDLGYDSSGYVYVNKRILTRAIWYDLTGLADFPLDSQSGDYGIDFSNGHAYCNGTDLGGAYWWDLTGLSDFPAEAVVGDLGWDTITGEVWRKTG